MQRQVFSQNHVGRHTAPGLACEDYLHQYSVGGIVQTPGLGQEFSEVMQLDEGSAWVKHYTLHPTKTPIFFRGKCNVERFKTYFAKCSVYVPYELPLGPFPLKLPKSYSRQVSYPTQPGVYKYSYMWKEEVEDTMRAGCYVEIHEGYGWTEMTDCNKEWADKAYQYRMEAPTKFIADKSKLINVSAIGHQGMKREHFLLVPEDQYQEGDFSIVSDNGEPINMFIRKEEDNKSAYMVHWNRYTIMACNRSVYQFALPYAREQRLVAIDYDSLLFIEKDERNRFIRKGSEEAKSCPLGSWLYTLHTNLRVLNHRSWVSDQERKTPGIPRRKGLPNGNKQSGNRRNTGGSSYQWRAAY